MLFKSIKMQSKIIFEQKLFSIAMLIVYIFIMINYFINIKEFYGSDVSAIIHGIHSFRHLFASLLVNQGVDIVTVSGALGHSTVSTTSNIYCHMMQDAQAKVSNAVSSALNFSANKKELKSV